MQTLFPRYVIKDCICFLIKKLFLKQIFVIHYNLLLFISFREKSKLTSNFSKINRFRVINYEFHHKCRNKIKRIMTALAIASSYSFVNINCVVA